MTEPLASDQRDPLEEIVASYLERRRLGERPALTEYLERCPERVEEIRELLSTLSLIEDIGVEGPLAPPAAGKVTADGVPLRRLGEYRIIREVGRGGMGVVFEAVQEPLGRHVALKVLPFHSMLDERHLTRFLRESRAAAGLHHTNIVPVFGIGEEAGIHYYAMQFIQGQPLDQVLAEVRWLREKRSESEQAAGPAVPISTGASSSSLLQDASREEPEGSHARYFHNVARMGLQVVEAMVYAHSQGVLHRDIKPSNLLLDASDRVWVTDFGLAKAEGTEDLTLTGDVVGTLAYMAPERLQGWSDVRSDLYSLGITLYECLTLRPAFSDTDRGRLIRKVSSEEPTALRKLEPQVPRDLETIVMKSIEKEPSRRYRTAEELAKDLAAFLEDRPIRARRASGAERVWRWCRRNPAVAGLGATAAVFLTIAAVAFFLALWLQGERTIAVRDKRSAEKSEGEARYWEAVAEARARRVGRRHGQRVESLATLKKAAERLPALELDPVTLAARKLDLRNQAVASLALDELVEERRWNGYVAGTTAIAFDLDGRRYARGDDRGTISVRSLVDDSELIRFAVPQGRTLHMRFNTDGRLLASEHWKGAGAILRLWDLEKGVSLHEEAAISAYQGHSGYALDFSPAGGRLAVGLLDGRIRIIALPSLTLEREIPSGQHGVPGVLRFHPGGGKLALAGSRWMSSTSVFVYDLAGGALLARIEHPEPIYSLDWHPAGKLIAAGCYYGQLYVTDAFTGARQSLCAGSQGTVSGVEFSHAGDLLASASWDGRIRVWDPFTGRERFWTPGGFSGPRFDFQRDDHVLAHAVQGKEVVLWKVAASAEYRTVQGPQEERSIRSIAASPDGRILASTNSNGVRLWDVRTGRETAFLPLAESCSALFHPSGRFLLTTGATGLERWPIERKEEAPGSLRIGPPEPAGLSVRAGLGDAALSRDGRKVVVIHEEHLHALDLESGNERLVPCQYPGLRWIALDPGGRWVATSSWNTQFVRVWDVERGNCVLHTPLESGALVSFSDDGKWLAIIDAAKIRLLEVGSWAERRTFPMDHSDMPAAVAFCTERRIAAVPRTSRIARLMDLDTGQELATLESPDPRHGITCLTFIAGGAYLAAGLGNNTIDLWDLRRIRSRLAELGLDWDAAPFPPAAPLAEAEEEALPAVEVVLGNNASTPEEEEARAESLRCSAKLLINTWDVELQKR